MLVSKLVVVLNKIDMVEEAALEAKISALRKVFKKTKFGDKVPFVCFSTKKQTETHCRKLKELLLQEL